MRVGSVGGSVPLQGPIPSWPPIVEAFIKKFRQAVKDLLIRRPMNFSREDVEKFENLIQEYKNIEDRAGDIRPPLTQSQSYILWDVYKLMKKLDVCIHGPNPEKNIGDLLMDILQAFDSNK